MDELEILRRRIDETDATPIHDRMSTEFRFEAGDRTDQHDAQVDVAPCGQR